MSRITAQREIRSAIQTCKLPLDIRVVNDSEGVDPHLLLEDADGDRWIMRLSKVFTSKQPIGIGQPHVEEAERERFVCSAGFYGTQTLGTVSWPCGADVTYEPSHKGHPGKTLHDV